MRPVASIPAVTAGLMCAPEMPTNLLTAIDTASPIAAANPNKLAPLSIGGAVLGIAAIPANQR